MAFESLSEKLSQVFKKLRGKGKLSEADIISPNPAGSSVNITLPVGFDDFAELEIFNAIGQKVYATELFSNNTNISVSELHDGLYFVVLKSGTKTQTAKLVIKR